MLEFQSIFLFTLSRPFYASVRSKAFVMHNLRYSTKLKEIKCLSMLSRRI